MYVYVADEHNISQSKTISHASNYVCCVLYMQIYMYMNGALLYALTQTHTRTHAQTRTPFGTSVMIVVLRQ